jgi:hypothetical protein
VAERLEDAVAVDYSGVSGPDWYRGVGVRIAAQAGGGRWVAVLHSGAGGFAPVIAAAASGLVFVDATLPFPGRSWIDDAPADLVSRLRGLQIGGRLVPWNQWFDPDPTRRLIPDPAVHAAFAGELPRVPYAFLEAVCPADGAWERLPAAYGQLSRAYDAEAAQAEARGWTVRRERLDHLAMLSRPDKVAALLTELCASLTLP